MRNAWLVSIATACGSSPSPPAKPPEIRVNVETFAELAVGPGNIAVTPDRRVFVSLHQFYEPADPVVELKNRIAACDGLLLVTPEYNNSLPGVFKNAIDWLSRPAADIPKVFGGRPVAIMGATPGGGGTILSQAAWLPVLRTLRMRPWFGPPLLVSNAGKMFDPSGKLTDDAVRTRLQDYLKGFAEFVRSVQHKNT